MTMYNGGLANDEAVRILGQIVITSAELEDECTKLISAITLPPGLPALEYLINHDSLDAKLTKLKLLISPTARHVHGSGTTETHNPMVTFIVSAEVRTATEEFLKAADVARTQRNLAVHSRWITSVDHPDQFLRFSTKSRASVVEHQEPFTLEKLRQILEDVERARLLAFRLKVRLFDMWAEANPPAEP